MTTLTHTLEADIRAGTAAVVTLRVASDMAIAGHAMTLGLMAITAMSAMRGLERRIRNIVNTPAAAGYELDADDELQRYLRDNQQKLNATLRALSDLLGDRALGVATRVAMSGAAWALRRAHAALGNAIIMLAEHDADASPPSGKSFTNAQDLISDLRGS